MNNNNQSTVYCEDCACSVKGQSEYFGVCPQCHKTDGYINVGEGHWFLCEEHKVRWFVGANLFSSCKDQTEEEQRTTYDDLDFSSFEHVESHNTYDIEQQGRLVSVEQYRP